MSTQLESQQDLAPAATTRLRILHIVLSIGETNATYNEHCLPMAEKRHISVCTYFRPTITIPSAIRLFGGDGSLPGFIRCLNSALRRDAYDVIHAHTPHVALLFIITELLQRQGVMPSTVVTVHDSYPNYRLRNRLLFLPVFARFARVVCCSRSSFDSFPALYRWLAGERLDFVQNGLDIARVDRIAKQSGSWRKEDGFDVIAISRLVEIKNPFTLLSAFRTAMDCSSRLRYIGDGPLRASLVATCTRAGSDGQVTFTGLLQRNRVFEHLLTADLFVSTSRGEGLPVAVLEAMACGCPVLLSDIPPHREIAGNSDFIPLVHPDDAAGFAREITRFRHMTTSERAHIGWKCRRLVERHFSLEAMHAGYESIYADIVAGRASMRPAAGARPC